MNKRTAWLLCAVWMLFIFLMSAMPGETSDEQSGLVATLLTRLFTPVLGEHPEALDFSVLNLLVRKAAHMVEYAVLFLLYRNALTLSGVHRPGAVALLLCVSYAATDEFHQRFVEGRGASPIDVMIDTAGAALAWGLLILLRHLPKHFGQQ